MFAEYKELLESFKQHKFSNLIETIIQRMLDILHSPRFNPRLAPMLSSYNKEGMPFSHCSLDPDPVSQIKKIINALYHARLSFIDLEQLDLNNTHKTLADLSILYNHTIHESYQATYLITHLDVDVHELFGEEFARLAPLIKQFQNIATHHTEHAKKILEQCKIVPLSYTAGTISGIAIEQMQPLDSDLDYSFLAQFSAELPRYIDKITQYILRYDELSQKEPGLNKEQITELRNTAIRLLVDLDHLKGNSFFLSLKVLNYAHIIRNILTLSMSILDQMGNLSDSSQDAIRYYLAQLKYKTLPELFALTDKIEIHAMLNPGTLSLPLMKKVELFYAQLIYYASKPVNFEVKGEDLLKIQDARFIALRLEDTHKRIDAANIDLFKINLAREALEHFYRILDCPLYSNLELDKLPALVKKELLHYYRLIKPYMVRIDTDLNDLIIQNLLDVTPGWDTQARNHWRRLRNQLPTNHIHFVLAKKTELECLILKKIHTQQFHIDLNMDLIHSVYAHTDIVLFPYNEPANLFTIDEALQLNDPSKGLQFKQGKKHNLLINPELLTAEQALNLYQWYRNKSNKLVLAKKAYQDFFILLAQHPQTSGPILHFHQLNRALLTRFKNLYYQFQPYLMNYLAGNDAYFDTQIVHALSHQRAKPISVTNLFTELNGPLINYFDKYELIWNKRSTYYLQLAQNKFQTEPYAVPIIHNAPVDKRAHHLIPHTRYSQFIREFRQSMHQLTGLFNQAMRIKLQAQTSGLPFPELEHKHPQIALYQTMAESQQVKSIKQIFNSLYHIEEIVRELERLTNRQSETHYVYHLFLAYSHLHEIHKTLKHLIHDPYFNFIARSLLNQVTTIYSDLMHQSEAYQVSPIDVGSIHPSVQYNALWYTLNAFFVIPQHINKRSPLAAKELEQLQLSAKKATLRIEKIIARSDSYFQLFLQSPFMFFLYKNLTKKLNEFTSTIHDTSLVNLNKFKSTILTPLLEEVDLFEDKLGLKPGMLSGTLYTILDEYYKGLVHALHLTSQTHIHLVCDNSPIDSRINLIHKKMAQLTASQIQLDTNQAYVEQLYQQLSDYHILTNAFFASFNGNLVEHRNHLIATYKLAYPQLVQAQKQFAALLDSELNNAQYDTLFVDIFPSETPITQIYALLSAAHHHYLGEKASFQMQLDTAQEKLAYLSDFKNSILQANQLFIQNYPATSFDKQLEDLEYCRMGLRYLSNEYRKVLKTYLITFKDELISEGALAEDINLKIELLIKDKVELFKQQSFMPYYKLDTVRIALAEFEKYIHRSNIAIKQNNSLFETKHTLEKKEALIKELIELSEDKNRTIQERLEQLKVRILSPEVGHIMLDYHKAEPFSFNHLKQCIIALLEALHLYTSERTMLYKQLNKSVDNPRGPSKLSTRFGLFATSSSITLVSSQDLANRATARCANNTQ